MLKLLVRKEKEKEDRGSRASVLLLARPKRLLKRLGQASRGYVLAGAGVVAAAVVFVSLLSWLAPDSDRPIGSPLEMVERVAGGVLEQVDEQVTALLGTDGESVLRSVREGVAAASSRTPWPGGGPREVAAERSSGADPAAPTSAASTASGKASSTSGGESSPASTSQPSSQQAQAPSPSRASEETPPPAADTPSPPTTNNEPAPPPASDQPPPATEEPSPPPAAEEPPPATEEPPPPPAEEPPPDVEEPLPPVVEEPSPAPVDPPLTKGPPQTIVDD